MWIINVFVPIFFLKFYQCLNTRQKDLRHSLFKIRFYKNYLKKFFFRPISVEEIVCIRLYEVGKSWSGVLRIGVTNVDPASFRDIELPKFVLLFF